MAIAPNIRNKFTIEDGRHFPNTFQYDAHAASQLLNDDGKVLSNFIIFQIYFATAPLFI